MTFVTPGCCEVVRARIIVHERGALSEEINREDAHIDRSSSPPPWRRCDGREQSVYIGAVRLDANAQRLRGGEIMIRRFRFWVAVGFVTIAGVAPLRAQYAPVPDAYSVTETNAMFGAPETL